MKLIFKGKTTSNDEELQKLGLKETDFLVVMNQVAVALLSPRNHSRNPKLKPTPPRPSSRSQSRNRKNQKNSLRKNQSRRICLPASLQRHKSMNSWAWVSLGSSALPHYEQPLVILIGQSNIYSTEFLRTLPTKAKVNPKTSSQGWQACLSFNRCEPCCRTTLTLFLSS